MDDHYASCRETEELGQPKRPFSQTFSAETPIMRRFFPEQAKAITETARVVLEDMQKKLPMEPVVRTDRRLWEVLVPTVRPGTGEQKFFKTRYHRLWDEKVRAISGGLTVLNPVKGQWVSPSGELFRERMIPVRVVATREEIDKVVQLVIDHYDQEAVMAYEISSEVILKFREK